MTGRSGGFAPARASKSTQPGGRRPAPGELALVQGFINTHYDLEVEHGAELLATSASARDWLSGSGLLDRTAQLAEGDLTRLRETREGLRKLASANGAEGAHADLLRAVASSEINQAARGAAVELRLCGEGPVFLPAKPGELDGAIGQLLALVARAMLDGSWARLKVCPGRDCGWAFYDHSRNGTGRWCSMAVCGARAKARAHYRRTRTTRT